MGSTKEQWTPKQVTEESNPWKSDDNRDDVQRFIFDLPRWRNFKRVSDAFADTTKGIAILPCFYRYYPQYRNSNK